MKIETNKIASLNRCNWVTWKTRIEDLLYYKDLYIHFEDSEQ